MKLISHRGNIIRPEPEFENRIWFIQQAIDQGYDVEIDVRLIDNSLFLGHDSPEHFVDIDWLLFRTKSLWIHTKNFEALNLLITYPIRVFYHQLEKHTVIGNTKNIWSHDITEASDKSIIPLIGLEDIEKHKDLDVSKYFGVCSDYIEHFNSKREFP